MFEVRATFPFEDDWQEMDAKVIDAAGGCESHFSGSGACRDMASGREHGWEVATYGEMVALKYRLEQVEGVAVRVREL